MRDPILHGTAQPFLPPDHWLLQHWPEHDAGTDEMSCNRCNHAVYHKDNGTVMTWIETGFVMIDQNPEGGEDIESHIYCLHCAAHMDYFTPVMHEKYHLNDDGSPQWQKARSDAPDPRWGGGI